MRKLWWIPIVFTLTIYCSDRNEKRDNLITIVDIGHLDRNGLAREIKIISEYEPRVIALDLLLTTDSLEKDDDLKEQLSRIDNIVQACKLHSSSDYENDWDSLETYHSKFTVRNYGYTNITTSEDGSFVRELPMRQTFEERSIPSFSYITAERSFGVKRIYKDADTDYYRFSPDDFRKKFKIISVTDVMKRNFEKNDLFDKIVILGFVGRDEDKFIVEDENILINGVEIQACFVSAIVDR